MYEMTSIKGSVPIKIDCKETVKVFGDILIKILEDIKENHKPMGYMPDVLVQDLDNKLHIEALYEKYSSGSKDELFTILSFIVEGNLATISFQDRARPFDVTGGVTLEYEIDEDRNISFKTHSNTRTEEKLN